MRERLGVMMVGCHGSSLGWWWSVHFLVVLEAGGPPGYGGEDKGLRRGGVDDKIGKPNQARGVDGVCQHG
jgi:hypothetical protein